MSGGYINRPGLKAGEHLLITFSFKGPITKVKCDKWDDTIDMLKALFGEQMIAITHAGEKTPRSRRAKKKATPK